MLKLSARMQAVADLVSGFSTNGSNNPVVADIGCDHAYVSIYLVQNKICAGAIAMDLRSGPLKIAKENISINGLDKRIETRLSDGFEKLNTNEADCAVIAGMGGLLMIDILDAGRTHTRSGIKLVLQPQSDIDRVRQYLFNIGYVILDEVMLIDEGKYYTVMSAAPSTEMVEPYSEEELCFGRCLIEGKNPVLYEYLMNKLHKNQELIDGMSHILSDKALIRKEELVRENKMIENVLVSFE